MKEKMLTKILFFLTIVSLFIFLTSGFSVLKDINVQKKAEKLYDSLSETQSVSISKNAELEKYRTLYKKNNDFTGWIQIKDTKIDYPIMKSTKADTNYYISRDFNKDYNPYGTPYIDFRCNLINKNLIIIYGHHMKDGTMFASLSNYKDKAFYQSHKMITVHYYENDTLIKNNYLIFSVIPINDANNLTYPYYDMVEFSANSNSFKDQYTSYINRIKKDSIYNIPSTPKANTPLLLLSTCDYDGLNGRILITAFKI